MSDKDINKMVDPQNEWSLPQISFILRNRTYPRLSLACVIFTCVMGHLLSFMFVPAMGHFPVYFHKMQMPGGRRHSWSWPGSCIDYIKMTSLELSQSQAQVHLYMTS